MAVRNVICPHCQQSVQVPDDLTRAHCVRCGRSIAVEETHVTARPSAFPPHIIQSEERFGRVGDDQEASQRGPAFTPWEKFRVTSLALQREVLKLARRRMPDLRHVYLQPLPNRVPAAIDAWKPPVGTIEMLGEEWFFFWFIGCSTMFIGCSGVFGGIAVAIEELAGRHQERPALGMPFILVMGLVMAGLLSWSIWRSFVRGRRLPFTMWFFEEGVFWKRGWRNGACRWRDVRNLHVGTDKVTHAPIFRLTADDGAKFALAPDQSLVLMPLLEFMEIRMTEAQLLPRLERIFNGDRVAFGAVALDRQGFASPRFYAPWSAIERVVRDPHWLYVRLKNRIAWHPVLYENVSFPLVVMAIADILVAELGESLASEREA